MVEHAPVIPHRSVADVRRYLQDHAHDDLQLIDVRQATEFQEAHIPGAELIPVSQLPSRLGSLNPDLPTFVYCRGGIRGAAAASFLLGAGFGEVYNIAGGVLAWQGRTVDGSPDAGMVWFSSARSLEDLIVQAWGLEEGARIYYDRGAEQADGRARALLRDLARDEDHHKAQLKALYRRLVGRPGHDVFDVQGVPEMMEGGIDLAQALAWIEGKEATAVLEVAMALETTAFDRYVQLERLAGDEASKSVFRVLAEGERRHLERISEVFDELLER